MSQYNWVQGHPGSPTVPTVPPGHPRTYYNLVRDHRGSSVRNQPPQTHQQTTDSQSVGILRGPTTTIRPLPQQSRQRLPPVDLPLQANFTNKLKQDKPQSMITQGSLLEVMQSGLESRARNQAGPLIQRLNNCEPQHNSPAYVNQMKAGPSHTSRPPTRSYGSGFTCQLCAVPPFANREDLVKHMNSKHQSPGATKARKRSNDGYMNIPLGVWQQRGAY